ncbi:MAG: ATP phosphoribosyltransferase, partial [Atribacterota bacterium]|nr:ATP phosphoribosyltransferase [Atribacterota bacterium]
MNKLTIAIPTGRLKEEAITLLFRMPCCPPFSLDSRKLVIEGETSPWRILLTHPKDVSTYVEYGVADLGIVGKDIILERGNEIYELLDLKIGPCTMVLAAPESVMPESLWE